MTRGSARRLGVAALVLGCLIALPGQAVADNTQTLTVDPVSANEDAGPLSFVVKLSAGPDSATFNYATANGSAIAGSDYTATSASGVTVAGGAEVTIQVPITGDDRHAPNESFALNISNIVGAANTTASATGTIVNDDAMPSIEIQGGAAARVEEGLAAMFSVSLTGKSEAPVSVAYAPENVTATQGSDYTLASGDIPPWAPGETGPKSLSVPTTEDTTNESDETFKVNLSAPANASLGTASATGTIVNDDPEPSIKPIVDVTVAEGNTGTVDAVMTVELSAASGKTVTVLYATAPGTATETPPPGDYQPLSGSLVFAPLQTSKTITVKVNGDTLFEPNEKFSVVLTDPDNAGPEPDNRGEITITDDDSTPTPTVTSPSAPEGNPVTVDNPGLSDLVFAVTLPSPRPAVTFNYNTVVGTATGSDFVEVGGSQITFPASTGTTPTTQNLTIKMKRDSLDELNESFTLQLKNPTTEAVVATATGTIVNDDNNSKLSINDASAGEPGTMTFTVTLSPASGRTVSVNWATANGTATAGADYTAGSGTLNFAIGEVSKTIVVAVSGDEINEENETLKVTLAGAAGAAVADATGDGTIIDRNAPPSLSISDAMATEGTGANFIVTLSGSTLRTVTVGFNTVDATATAGSDYTARVGTLTFAPGEGSKTISVTVLDDTATEPTEDFFVVLGDPVNATITKNRGLGAIDASDQLVEAPKPPTGPKPPTTPQLIPRMILGPRTVTIGVNGLARMLITCQKASPIGCAGTVELERAARPLLTLGKKTFSVKKGTKAYASIKLTARGLAILRKNGTLRAKVVVVVKTSTKTMKVSPGIITLKGTKALLTSKPKPPATTTQVVVDPKK